MIQVTATEFKANLGKYLALVGREDIHITKNGTDIAVLTASKSQRGWVEELAGVIPFNDIDIQQTRAERLVEKYESLD